MSNSQIDFLVRCKALGLENGKLSDWLDEIESLQAENAALKEQVITLEKLQGVALIDSLRAEVAQTEFRNERLVSDQAKEEWLAHDDWQFADRDACWKFFFEAGRASMMAEFEQVELYDEVDVRVPGDIELLEAGTKLYRLKGEK